MSIDLLMYNQTHISSLSV